VSVLLEPPVTRWECPNCDLQDVTRCRQVPHTRMHACRGLKGLTAPMVPAGVKAKVVAVEREDYIGREVVTVDPDGRPVMNVTTVRDDGQDCTVFAPCATAVIG
jgi:hypothetical protein